MIWGQTIGKTGSRDADSFFDIFTELSLVGDEPRDLSPAVQLAGTESGQEK